MSELSGLASSPIHPLCFRLFRLYIIGGSVVDNVPPVTGLIGWRSVVELRRLRLVLMRVVDDEMDW